MLAKYEVANTFLQCLSIESPRPWPLILERMQVCGPLTPAAEPHLRSEGEVGALSVSDDAGVHGGLCAPAPLQVAHSVLVQVTRKHSSDPRPNTTGRELHPALSSHEAGVVQTQTHTGYC